MGQSGCLKKIYDGAAWCVLKKICFRDFESLRRNLLCCRLIGHTFIKTGIKILSGVVHVQRQMKFGIEDSSSHSVTKNYAKNQSQICN